MTRFFTIPLILLLGINLKAQVVSIPDTNFLKNLISWGVDKNNDGQIQNSEAEFIKGLLITGTTIKDLTGIEAFTNLISLDCRFNLATKLDLRKNTKLTELIFNGNELSSLDISMCPELEKIWCPNNKLTKLELEQNTKLVEIQCSDNMIAMLDVSNQPHLTSLNCSGNRLTELNISKNTQLITLSCAENKLKTLDVSQNLGLKSLYILDNELATLDIRNNKLLNFINCQANPNLVICLSNEQLDKTTDTRSWNKDISAQWNTTCSLVTEIGDQLIAQPSKIPVRVITPLGQYIQPEHAVEGMFIYQYSDGSLKKVVK